VGFRPPPACSHLSAEIAHPGYAARMDDKHTEYRGSDDVAEDASEATPPDADLAKDSARGDGLATDAGTKDPPDDLAEDSARGDGLANDA
jgi:hypothetical protein